MLYDRKLDLDEDQKVLLRVRDYIQEHGWCQNFFENGKGEVCLAGALRKVLGLPIIDSTPNENNYYRFLGKFELVIGSTVGRWNDEDYRTKEQVIDVLDQLIWRKKEEVNGL